jgi:hypothetical protein
MNRNSPFAGLRFWFELQMLRGLKTRLLMASLIVVAVAVTAGFLVSVLSEDFSNPAEAIWWAFLRLTDPGYLGDDEGVAKRAISTVVTVLGYLLFLGLLIAILTQWLNETVRRVESGVTPVVLSNHVLILGWTNQTRAITESLLDTGSRAKRFLARRRAKQLRVVIMADRVDDELRQRFFERFGRDAGRRVLLRTGSPLRVDHLERAAYRSAAVLILPGAGFAESNPQRVDAETVKTLASVSTSARQAGVEPPLAVAEIFDSRAVALAHEAYDGESEIIGADGIVGRLMAQSIRHRGLWDVLNEVFMLNRGNAVHLRPIERQDGARFGDLRERFERAILLGFVRPGEDRPILNPDPETVLGMDDLPIFLARDHDDCEPGPVSGEFSKSSAVREATREPAGGTRRILLFGWSRKVPALLRQLGRYGNTTSEVDVVSGTPLEEREADLANHAAEIRRVKVNHVVAGFSTPGVIEKLEPQRYSHVIVMASEILDDKEQADAISVTAALTLRGLFRERDTHPEVMVELMDRETQSLFRGGHEDVIVSPAVVSYIVSQVALKRELAWVFWELTRPWGGQIELRDAAEYLGESGEIRFEAVQRAASALSEIALGLRRPRDGEPGLALNPDRDAVWILEPGDEVVVLTWIEEPVD